MVEFDAKAAPDADDANKDGDGLSLPPAPFCWLGGSDEPASDTCVLVEDELEAGPDADEGTTGMPFCINEGIKDKIGAGTAVREPLFPPPPAPLPPESCSSWLKVISSFKDFISPSLSMSLSRSRSRSRSLSLSRSLSRSRSRSRSRSLSLKFPPSPSLPSL